jgi:hypothetical protein
MPRKPSGTAPRHPRRSQRFIDYFNRTFAKPFRWTYTGRPITADTVKRPPRGRKTGQANEKTAKPRLRWANNGELRRQPAATSSSPRPLRLCVSLFCPGGVRDEVPHAVTLFGVASVAAWLRFRNADISPGVSLADRIGRRKPLCIGRLTTEAILD